MRASQQAEWRHVVNSSSTENALIYMAISAGVNVPELKSIHWWKLGNALKTATS